MTWEVLRAMVREGLVDEVQAERVRAELVARGCKLGEALHLGLGMPWSLILDFRDRHYSCGPNSADEDIRGRLELSP